MGAFAQAIVKASSNRPFASTVTGVKDLLFFGYPSITVTLSPGVKWSPQIFRYLEWSVIDVPQITIDGLTLETGVADTTGVGVAICFGGGLCFDATCGGGTRFPRL